MERPRCIWWLVWVYLCRSSIRKSIERRNFASLSVSFGRGSVAELVLNLFPRLNAVLIAVIECWVRCWIPYLSRNQSERFRLADTCESLIEEDSLTIMFWLDVWAACWLKRTQSRTILCRFLLIANELTVRLGLRLEVRNDGWWLSWVKIIYFSIDEFSQRIRYAHFVCLEWCHVRVW